MKSMTVCIALIAIIATTSLLVGCASTKVEFTGQKLREPLCRADEPPISVVLYWTTQWRTDQKEPQLREAAAQQGLKAFLDQCPCLSATMIERLPPGQLLPSTKEAVRMAASLDPAPDRIVLVAVRELGPKLIVGLPVIVEGGTEVLIDVRVVEPKTQHTLAENQTLWRNGGIFVIKGIKTLESALRQALSATLMEPDSTR